MKLEFSAGGVVYKYQKSNIKNQKSKMLILLAQHSQHHGWVFPKGLIGDNIKGEKKEDTAVREVKEETGIDAEITKELQPVTYWYVFKGEKIKKTVFYYIMKYLGGDFKNRDNEMENVEWVLFNKVETKLTYSSDKKVWQEAKKIIGGVA